MSKKRRNHSDAFKAKVALAAIREDKTIAEISSQYGVHASQVNAWKKQVLNNLEAIFAGNYSSLSTDHQADKIKELHAKIGELTVERDFFDRALNRIR